MKNLFFTLLTISFCFYGNAQTVSFTTSPAAVTNDAAGRTAAGQQDDNLHTTLDNSCVAASGLYIPVYGTFNFAAGATSGTITGLILPNGTAYSGTVTISVRNMDGSAFGTAATCTPTLTAGNNIQSNAPFPAAASGRFSEGCGNASTPNGVLIQFSIPITTPFGLWLGDVESRTDGVQGVAGKVKIFNNTNTQIGATTDIPTSTVAQSSCNGNGTGNFTGCGNDETIFMTITPTVAVPVSSVLIEVGSVTNGTVNSNAIGIAGPTMGGSCSVALPLASLNFSARLVNNDTKLTWDVSDDADVKYYYIEKSTTGRVFSTIAVVNAQGLRQYNFTDNAVAKGITYYRIKIAEINGSSYYSPILRVKADGAFINITSIFPSPARESITVNINNNNLKSNATMQITDLSGKAIMTKFLVIETGSANNTIDISSLKAGLYLIKITANGETVTEKFVKSSY
jgi:hypothetical protein